jgi:hypothetical protein
MSLATRVRLQEHIDREQERERTRRKRKHRDWDERTYQPSPSVRSFKKAKQVVEDEEESTDTETTDSDSDSETTVPAKPARKSARTAKLVRITVRAISDLFRLPITEDGYVEGQSAEVSEITEVEKIAAIWLVKQIRRHDFG